MKDPFLIRNLSGRRSLNLGNNLSYHSGASLALPVTQSLFCIFLNLFAEYHSRIQMGNMHRFCISCVKYHIDQLSGKVGQLSKKACLVLMIHFLIHLLHIYSLGAKDLCMKLLFVFIKNLDIDRFIRNSPAPDP